MKELVAKEFIFLFVALIVAIPVGIIYLYLVNFEPGLHGSMTQDEKVLEMDLLLIGCLIGFIGVYITRLAVWAVKAVLIS
jgi:hypothetical protein